MRKRQIKTIVRYYFTPTRVTIIKEVITSVGEDMEKPESSVPER
jgi:hypothetical protein